MTYEDRLKEIVVNDERFIVLSAEYRTGINNLPLHLGERFIDTGITEMTLTGICTGLALRGRIPIAHAIASFLTMRAFEFIRTDIGIANLPVKLIGGMPGFLSEAHGPAHQALEDIALMRSIPNINIFCPADENDMIICLQRILEDSSPYYIRNIQSKPVICHSKDFEPGKAEIIKEGKDITIFTYGLLFSEAYSAVEILEKKGYSAGIINTRTLKPFDEKTLLTIAQNSKLLVTVEDHFITGGLFSIVSEVLTKNKVSANLLPLALNNKWFRPSFLNSVIDFEGFTPEKIASKVEEHIKNYS